jgi:hypothetical protein
LCWDQEFTRGAFVPLRSKPESFRCKFTPAYVKKHVLWLQWPLRDKTLTLFLSRIGEWRGGVRAAFSCEQAIFPGLWRKVLTCLSQAPSPLKTPHMVNFYLCIHCRHMCPVQGLEVRGAVASTLSMSGFKDIRNAHLDGPKDRTLLNQAMV